MPIVTNTSAESQPCASNSSDQVTLRGLLERVKVPTGVACTTAESTRFLQSTRRLALACSEFENPTAQDIECLRQAAWKYRLETGADKVAATELMPVLQRLGYA